MKWFDADKYIGSDSISVIRKTITESFPLHWHNFFEIEVILGGKAKHIFNGNEYQLEAGYVYMLTPADLHEIIPEGSTEIFNIMFHDNLISDHFLNMLSDSNGDTIMKLNASEFEEIKKICFLIENEYKRNDLFKDNIIENLLECLMLKLLRKTIKGNNKSLRKSTAIQKALRFINLHFKENPTLSDVAGLVNYTPHYFSQKFKSETGFGFNEYLNRKKLSYAKLLLKSDNLSITEICYASGFTSISNFLRCFNIEEGISPSAYRSTKLC